MLDLRSFAISEPLVYYADVTTVPYVSIVPVCMCLPSEDERDLLYFIRFKPPSILSKSKWSVEQVPLKRTKLDGVEVEFNEPIDKYDQVSVYTGRSSARTDNRTV